MAEVLQYHRAIFQLLAIQPKVSPPRVAQLQTREEALGFNLPASLREFYVLENAEELFCDHTNYDELQPLSELGDARELAGGYLRIGTENQGVFAWYAHLDGSEDPTIYHNNDQWEDDVADIDWKLCAFSFSNFVYDQVTQFHFEGRRSGACLEGEAAIPSDDVLAALRSTYGEGPLTSRPETKVWRFFSPHGQIRFACNTPELLAEGRAFWWIEADSLERLPDLLNSVWEIEGVPTLEPAGFTPKLRERGTEVVESVKRARE